MSDLAKYRARSASKLGEQAARAAIASAIQPAGILRVRVIRSVTIGHPDERNESRSYFIDLAIPFGVPLSPGDAILVSVEDIVTPIVHSFWDHANGTLVVTTTAVTYFEQSIEDAERVMIERGWNRVES